MSVLDTVYFSLDEARAELARRWADIELRKRIETALGDTFMPCFLERARGVLGRQLCSPDNGFTFFHQCARFVGAEPLDLEYHGDIFVVVNEEKKGLGRLRLTLPDGSKATVDIMDFHAAEKLKLGEVVTKSGEFLVDFHHGLHVRYGLRVELRENSAWYRSVGMAADYYFPFLAHFVAHGVLFETFDMESDREQSFTERIVVPAIDRVRTTCGLNPLIVRLYPENQTEDEDFYWWSYPPVVNDWLLRYAEENKLTWRTWKPKK